MKVLTPPSVPVSLPAMCAPSSRPSQMRSTAPTNAMCCTATSNPPTLFAQRCGVADDVGLGNSG